MRIALIGSRSLSDYENCVDASKYYDLCLELARIGMTMTSGLCPLGADAIAQRAYAHAIDMQEANVFQLEVYVSCHNDIIKSTLPYASLAMFVKEHQKEARKIAKSIHPAWDKCNEYAKDMHTRNVHQILGRDMKTPVDAVVCWTPNGKKKGGTRTAIVLAEKHNIPVFNLGNGFEKVKSEIYQFLMMSEL